MVRNLEKLNINNYNKLKKKTLKKVLSRLVSVIRGFKGFFFRFTDYSTRTAFQSSLTVLPKTVIDLQMLYIINILSRFQLQMFSWPVYRMDENWILIFCLSIK